MPPERPKGSTRPVVIMAAMLVIAATSLVAYGIFAGGHSTYMNQPEPDDFCDRCHPEIATALMAGEHSPANCICHGYNPNHSEGMAGTDFDINMKHNLSKNIYCTSCHSEYDDVTGEIDIGNDASGLDQSAHYIINTSKKAMLYNHSAQQFK